MAVDWSSASPDPANCSAAGAVRGCALRLATFRATPPTHLFHAAAAIAAGHGSGRGRVQAGGTLSDTAALATLRAPLSGHMADALRPSFEWYSCRGAHFHNDAHYGDVLFGAWYLAGPDVDLVFPRTGWRIASTVGTAVVFDPFEPHGVLRPREQIYSAEHYADAAPSVFLAFEIALTDAVRTAFGIGAPVVGASELSSDRAVNAETGAL